MKKRLAGIMVFLCVLVLSGCCLSHDWRDATCTEAKTCVKCGATEGEPIGHTWKDATCTEAKTCTACVMTEGEPTGHTWKHATCTEPKTCTICGATEGTARGHRMAPADREHPATCKRCGETFGEPLVDYDPFLDLFQIPAELGPAEYSREEICRMVEDDLTLDEVAERIHTYPDLVQYLHNRNYTVDNGDLHFYYHGREYSVNRSAQTAFDANKGNCGGGSNLVNYILRGDYDSQGYVILASMCGGHVYNYFERDGYYYFCDLMQIVLNNTANEFAKVKDPLEYAERYVGGNHYMCSPKDDHYMLLQYMYEWEGNHLPIGMTNAKTAKGYPFMNGFVEEIADTAQILFLEEGCPQPEAVDSPPADQWPQMAR